MPVLLDLEAPFPFLNHFTQREAMALEGLRVRLTDDAILDKYVEERFMGREVEEVAGYLLRNPRERVAA